MNMKNYTIGFFLSLLLTLAAYALVELHLSNHHEWPPHSFIIPAIILFALVQFAVQVIFFLHVGGSAASRDRLVVLCFAVLVVLILVSGSLWIMLTLNGRMMPSEAQMTQYMDNQQGI